jgi:hypothetical protein
MTKLISTRGYRNIFKNPSQIFITYALLSIFYFSLNIKLKDKRNESLTQNSLNINNYQQVKIISNKEMY